MTMKAMLQAAITSGQIDTKQKLLERAEALGLTVRAIALESHNG